MSWPPPPVGAERARRSEASHRSATRPAIPRLPGRPASGRAIPELHSGSRHVVGRAGTPMSVGANARRACAGRHALARRIEPCGEVGGQRIRPSLPLRTIGAEGQHSLDLPGLASGRGVQRAVGGDGGDPSRPVDGDRPARAGSAVGAGTGTASRRILGPWAVPAAPVTSTPGVHRASFRASAKPSPPGMATGQPGFEEPSAWRATISAEGPVPSTVITYQVSSPPIATQEAEAARQGGRAARPATRPEECPVRVD